MNQKIDKAAREYAAGQLPSEISRTSYSEHEKMRVQFATGYDLQEAFETGCNFCRTLPLSERLRPDEIKRIRGFYNGETFKEVDFIEIISCRRILENLFGREMFEEEE